MKKIFFKFESEVFLEMLGVMLMIVIVVWAIKELAEGTGVSDRIRYGKQSGPSMTEKREE